MSDQRNGRDEASDTDALLSALIDGDLAPEVAATLRARIANEPALAERLVAFERLGGALRSLPSPQVPADLASRTHAKIAAQQREESAQSAPAPSARRAARPRSGPRRRRPSFWPAAAGIAAAAALALYLSLPDQAPGPLPTSTPAPLLAQPTPGLQASVSLLASAGDDELGIALYYDELSDLQMLEQLELLEILAALEEAEQS